MQQTSSAAITIARPWEGTRAFEWIFIALGGLPLFLPLILWAGEGQLASQDPVYWYYWMGAIFSTPHVFSTYMRLGRKMNEGRVSKWFGVPGYLGCIGLLLFCRSRGVLLQAMTAVNVWQTIHYVRQGYGVNRFFSRGSKEDDLDRRLSYWAFHLAMPLFVFGRWDTLYTVWRGIPSNVIIPVHFPPLFMQACWALFFVAVALGLYVEGKKIRRGLEGYDPIGLVTLLVFYAIHVYGFLVIPHYQRGFFAVTVFHGIQYLALLWLLEKQVSVARPAGFLVMRVLQQIPFTAFWVLFFLISFGIQRYAFVAGDSFLPGFSIIALGAVSAHHYLVDSVLWRAKVGR